MSPVADFGCGHGPLSILTARFGLSVTAFDCIEDNINNGNRLKTLDDRVEFVQCFLTDIPAADNSFASGVCKEVLEHIVAPEIPKVLREIQRVMRPGAVVIFTVPRETILRSIAPLEHVTFFESPTRLATYLKAHGFKIVKKEYNRIYRRICVIARLPRKRCRKSMKTRILFIYSKRKLKQYNSPLHTQWVNDCRDDFKVRFWGKGFGSISLLSLKKTIDRFKPDAIYLTLRGRYEKWLPDLSSVQVPKIFVEVDGGYYSLQDPWYAQFDKVYTRNRWRENDWSAVPLFRWSVSEKNICPFPPDKRQGVRFVGSMQNAAYDQRNALLSQLEGLVETGSERNNRKYWKLLRSSGALICPTEHKHGNFVPGKILEYLASGAAVLTNCDLAGYDMADLDRCVVKYNDAEHLKSLLTMDFSPYYEIAFEALRAHTHRVRYRELFESAGIL